MYAIGKAAEMCNTTVRTIRYYDEVGLLRPTEIKRGGHRYYNKAAIVRLDTIITMKKFGFSLDEIKTTLSNQSTSAKELLQMRLRLIKSEQEKLLEMEKQINATLQLMDMENVEEWQEIVRIYQSLLQYDEKSVDANRDVYFTEEENKALQALPQVGESDELSEMMAALVKDIHDHLETDSEPTSEAAEQLAWRWIYLTDRMYKGNWELANKAWQISQYEGNNIGMYHYDTEVVSFITKAIDSFFQKRGLGDYE